jgi:hypothetical protein
MQAERTFISINYVASRMVSQCHHKLFIAFPFSFFPNFFDIFAGPHQPVSDSFIQNIAWSVQKFSIFVLIDNPCEKYVLQMT